MKKSAGLIALFSFALVSLSAEAKVVKDNGQGKCQMSVPDNWKVDDFHTAKSPDGKVEAVVNGSPAEFSFLKESIKGTYKKEMSAPKIEDSSTKISFEVLQPSPFPGKKALFTAGANGKESCTGQVLYAAKDKKALEIGTQVIKSIGPAK